MRPQIGVISYLNHTVKTTLTGDRWKLTFKGEQYRSFCFWLGAEGDA